MFEAVILTVTLELTQNEIDALLPLVSPEKQERIKQFHFFRDARNCLLGDILARAEICRFTDLSMNQIEFAVNEYGKPFVVGKPRIQFNISHTGHYIACVIADEPVGIDIELIK
jgi:4'-phosphopantetheinyl transferase